MLVGLNRGHEVYSSVYTLIRSSLGLLERNTHHEA